MKKFDFRNIRFRKVNIEDLDDRTLLLNLYVTQVLTLIVGVVLLMVQGRSVPSVLQPPQAAGWVVYGLGFAAAVVIVDLVITRWVSHDVLDDGGINERLFRSRPLWHIALIALIVSICEELLFRGAVQYALGPYWTSIVFAAIHVRYLRHWLMTGLVFGISYGLGWIYIRTGTIWAPIAAHFAIDFVLGCMIKYGRDSNDHGT